MVDRKNLIGGGLSVHQLGVISIFSFEVFSREEKRRRRETYFGSDGFQRIFENLQIQDVNNEVPATRSTSGGLVHFSHPPHRKFLRFGFEGRIYEFTVLPFGVSLSPRVLVTHGSPVTGQDRYFPVLRELFPPRGLRQLQDVYAGGRSYGLCHAPDSPGETPHAAFFRPGSCLSRFPPRGVGRGSWFRRRVSQHSDPGQTWTSCPRGSG